MCDSLCVVARDTSRADLDLAERVGVTARQIERWRHEGCLQPPEWAHRAGSVGSVSAHPASALEQAHVVRRLLETPPRLIPGAKASFDEVRIVLFWQCRYVQPDRLRDSYLALLARIPDTDTENGDVRELAKAMAGRARGTAGVRTWIDAVRLANRLGRADVPAAAQVRSALTVLFSAVLGALVAAEHAADAVDNLGFDLDDTITGEDLRFLDVAAVREVVRGAGHAEFEAARDAVALILRYSDALAFIGARTDRSLRWPALSIVSRRLLAARSTVPAAFVPFAVTARRQFLAQDPEWDRTLQMRVSHAEACVSLLRAVPRRLHRFIPATGQAAKKASASQQRALLGAVREWTAAHPHESELIARNLPADDGEAR